MEASAPTTKSLDLNPISDGGIQEVGKEEGERGGGGGGGRGGGGGKG